MGTWSILTVSVAHCPVSEGWARVRLYLGSEKGQSLPSISQVTQAAQNELPSCFTDTVWAGPNTCFPRTTRGKVRLCLAAFQYSSTSVHGLNLLHDCGEMATFHVHVRKMTRAVFVTAWIVHKWKQNFIICLCLQVELFSNRNIHKPRYYCIYNETFPVDKNQ